MKAITKEAKSLGMKEEKPKSEKTKKDEIKKLMGIDEDSDESDDSDEQEDSDQD